MATSARSSSLGLDREQYAPAIRSHDIGSSISPSVKAAAIMVYMKRIAVVGSSGAGKTWLASRLAVALGVPHVELDAIRHGPGWAATPPEEMLHQLDLRCPADGRWVADGNYETNGGAVTRERADTVLWLDFPRWLVMRQLVLRTVRRALVREQLWNGNRESLRAVLSLTPERSVILWSWTQHEPQRARYLAQVDDRWIRLTSRTDVRRFLADIHTLSITRDP